MVGSGVLIECLESETVDKVVALGRRSYGVKHSKLTEIIHDNFCDYSKIESNLTGFDACFFCLGTSSAGMKEAEYRRISYDFPVKLSETLLKTSPDVVFCLLTGAGTDATLKSSMMWARVKGRAENQILSMGFKQAYCFRPGFIQPLKGIKPSWKFYKFTGFLYPLLKKLPKYVCNTVEVGLAMIAAATKGAPKRTLESKDIVSLAKK